MRYCKSKCEGFDVFFCVGAGLDCGQQSIQYFGYKPVPMVIQDAPRWHYFLKRRFMQICELVSSFSLEIIKQNVTLVNSQWIGKAVKHVYAVSQYQVVYPPVSAPSAMAAWDRRQDGFLCVSRIVPYKQIDQVIEIIRRVRESGFDVSLKVIGRPDHAEYYERISQLRDRNQPWLTLQNFVPNQELTQMMGEYKYGIHGARDEPFGIGVAEMVKAGCIVFVPDDGGQTEIVGTSKLTNGSIDEAVARITSVLGDETLQKTLQDDLGRRGKTFSSQAFSGAVRRVVNDYFAQPSAPGSGG